MVNLRSHATRLGVLDIGSNTVHMLIVDAAPGARPEPEASVKSTVRLMQYLKEDGTIRKAGVEAVLEAVHKAMKLAEEYEITQLLVLATSALREAPNGGRILRRIEEAIGQPVTVLSGVDEARLTFLAARRWYGWDAGRLLVLDIGGGSLEVAMGSDEDPTVALSVPAGAGRVTRELLPESGVADVEELEKARKQIRKILNPMVEAFPKSKHPMHAVGTSKTIRSLARLAGAVLRQPGRVDTSVMTRDQLEDWLPRLASISPDQRVALPGVTPERTYQIVGGGLVIDEIMRALDVEEIEICPWALREGAILRWLDQFGRTRLGF
ncbi:Ppx/GppA phosphatase family protein [Bifidobacterium moukalabense]|uniref:Ppx/GppA phosphatase family protein n=1 Tax=Bifidobacterium moukalabense TaxID=1333651 RepID=UPI0010F4A961|nr:Ppx/GppA phosphatase family protein [Bifidobacterium moukalabense]